MSKYLLSFKYEVLKFGIVEFSIVKCEALS